MRALTFLAALCTLVVAGCGGGSEGEAAASAPPPVTETAGPEDTAMRPTAPPIEGTTLDGEKAVLADLRGKQVFVNVWSSWWSTCQSEAVAYAEFQQNHPELAFLGLDVADTPEEGRAFVERYGWSWPSISDPERDRARSLGATYQPHVFVVDARGRVVASYEGRGNAEIWESLATQLP